MCQILLILIKCALVIDHGIPSWGIRVVAKDTAAV